jgi:hypothetical protein
MTRIDTGTPNSHAIPYFIFRFLQFLNGCFEAPPAEADQNQPIQSAAWECRGPLLASIVKYHGMLTGTQSALVARFTLPPTCALCADCIARDTPMRNPAKNSQSPYLQTTPSSQSTRTSTTIPPREMGRYISTPQALTSDLWLV